MVDLPFRILIVENSPDRQKILKNLFKDHAWILVNTARRAIRLLSVYDFDLIALDYDLDGEETGDKVAEFLKQSRNADAKVWVHSMNVQGVNEIQKYLPDSVAIPFSKIIRNNRTFKKLQQSINNGLEIDWTYVFRRKDD